MAIMMLSRALPLMHLLKLYLLYTTTTTAIIGGVSGVSPVRRTRGGLKKEKSAEKSPVKATRGESLLSKTPPPESPRRRTSEAQEQQIHDRQTAAASDELIPLVEYDCQTELKQVQTTEVLSLQGDWTATNTTAVEAVFVEAYNSLAFTLCDWPHFRSILAANASVTQYDYEFNTTVFEFDVLAACRSCDTQSLTLFHQPTTTLSDEALLLDTSEAVVEREHNPPPDTKSSQPLCLCPANATAFRPPTRKEVTGALEDWTQQQSSSELGPLEEVICSTNITQFTSYVYVDLQLKRNEVMTLEERQALEATFLELYNQLSFQVCDPYFRNILQVHLQDDAVISVVAKCRDCPVSQTGSYTLFDGISERRQRQRRRSLFSELKKRRHSPQYRQEQERQRRNLQQSNTTTCVCPADTAGEHLALSNMDFVEVLNAEIVQLQADGLLESVEAVESLQEAQSVECDGEVQTFTTTVYADVTVSLDELGQDERSLLEGAFQSSYNALAFANCDGMFREVVDISLEQEMQGVDAPFISKRRQLLGNAKATLNGTFADTNATSPSGIFISENATRQESTAVFSITGQCRNCMVSDTGSFSLFDDAFRRRRRALQTHSDSPVLLASSRRALPSIADSCICPAGTQPDDNGELSAAEFTEVFNKEVEKEQEGEPSLGDIELTVDSVAEGHEVECGADVKPFETRIFSDLQVNLTSLTAEEVSILEQSFKRTYNNLAFSHCDGYFRAIEGVQLRIGQPEKLFPNRRLQETFNSTGNATTTLAANISTAEPQYVGSTVFSVTGQCRNCPVSETGHFNLFDDAFRRRSLVVRHTREFDSFSRHLQTNGTCICPSGVDPGIIQGPSAMEFESAYIEDLESLSEGGEATSVAVTATDVTEGHEVSCSPDIQSFQSATIADLGVDPSLLTAVDKSMLETNFQSVYNSLSFSACDGFFRLVSEVELVQIDTPAERKLGDHDLWIHSSRHLSASNTTTNSTESNATVLGDTSSGTSAAFVVTGRCRNCPVDNQGSFTLFDDAFRRARRRAKSLQLHESGWRRNLEEDLNLCICPPGQEPGEEPAPTVDEFVAEFNLKLEESKEEGSNITVQKVTRVVEVTPAKVEVAVKSFNDTATPRPTPASTPQPTDATTPSPIQTPKPSPQPTAKPTQTTPFPTLEPTAEPTPQPTAEPTAKPSLEPTPDPTSNPTAVPTPEPTRVPTTEVVPTTKPTKSPTSLPSPSTSPKPSLHPSESPSSTPSNNPTGCNHAFETYEAQYFVFYDGNTGGLSDLDLEDSFTAADVAVEKTECSPIVIGATVYQRLNQRRLQETNGFTDVIVFIVESLQQSNGFMFQTEKEKTDFLTGMNTNPRLQSAGVEAVNIQSSYSTDAPTNAPTLLPTGAWPSATPSQALTKAPTANPTSQPTMMPTREPTQAPNLRPTLHPSYIPTSLPSTIPSGLPSNLPSSTPSDIPSKAPTTSPTQEPTTAPSRQPTAPSINSPSTTPSKIPTTAPRNFPTAEPSSTPSIEPSVTPSVMPSILPSSSPSLTPLKTPTAEPSIVPTTESSSHPSTQPSAVPTEVPTSRFPSGSPTQAPAIVPTGKPSTTPTKMPSISPKTVAPSGCPSDAPSIMPTASPSTLPTQMPTTSPSKNPTRPPTTSPLQVPTTTPSGDPTKTPSQAPTKVPTQSPTKMPTDFPSFTPTLAPSASPTKAPTKLPTKMPTKPPSPAPSPTPSNSPTKLPTTAPTQHPSPGPSLSPSKFPTKLPSAIPTAMPTKSPSVAPSLPATKTPTKMPTAVPTQPPSVAPSPSPSKAPTKMPTASPTTSPSASPSLIPSASPSRAPSASPSSAPTNAPSPIPTSSPTKNPTANPTKNPTANPSKAPTGSPTKNPTKAPSASPTKNPTKAPTKAPTKSPTASPTTTPYPCFTTRLDLDNAIAADYTNNGEDPYTTYGPITGWCFDSGLTDFSDLFSSHSLTENINGWDVQHVQNMANMFNLASYSGSLASWNVAAVTDMSGMFQFETGSYNDDLSAWNTASVQTFRDMFGAATLFNGNVSGWDLSSCTDIQGMFAYSMFDQDLSSWVTTNVVNMNGAFSFALSFNQDISGWDVSSVTDFQAMFQGGNFNVDISAWNVQSASFMGAMFDGALEFQQDLCPWGDHINTLPDVTNMFGLSACTNTNDPTLGPPVGPLCATCP